MQCVFGRRHADGTTLDDVLLPTASPRHKGLIQGVTIPSDQLGEGVQRAARVKSSGGKMLDGVEASMSRSRVHYSNFNGTEARPRGDLALRNSVDLAHFLLQTRREPVCLTIPGSFVEFWDSSPTACHRTHGHWTNSRGYNGHLPVAGGISDDIRHLLVRTSQKFLRQIIETRIAGGAIHRAPTNY